MFKEKCNSLLGLVFVLCSALLTNSVTAAGPVSPYYLTGDQKIFVLQGSAVGNSWTQPGFAFPIAVDATVRTFGYTQHWQGAEYTLAGNYTGTNYLNDFAGAFFYDGTTNGTNNYLVSYAGQVFSTQGDWTNEQSLFTAAGSEYGGITYDVTNSTLWLLQYTTGVVENYSLTGTLLSSFTASTGGFTTALALDRADNTLWMANQVATLGQHTFFQYSKTGDFLGSQSYALDAGSNILGGEFGVATAPIPEPSTYALMLVGLGFVGFVAKRRRKAQIAA